MHPVAGPLVIDMTKERKNSILAGSLSCLRAVADFHHEQVCAVLGRFDVVVPPTTDTVAEENVCAEEKPHRVAFGMRRDRSNNIARKTREGLFRQDGKLTDPWTGIAFCRVSNRGFGFSRERGLDYFLDCRGPRKLLHIVKILEIIRAVWTELGNRDYTANCGRRFRRLRCTGVADGAVIVIGQQHDAVARKLRP